ncbi:MAG: 30S ribosomal protein S1 [Lentisphaeria bacterium]|nr:30S ribosomal protein S1 [Lentisphaeria bacterium]
MSNELPNLADLFDFSESVDMNTLLAGEDTQQIEEGSVVVGKVVRKTDNGVSVDFNFKSEGFVPKHEIPNFDEIEVGSELNAVLESIESEDDGLPVLSVEKAIFKEAWDKFTKVHEEGAIVKGEVKRRVKGGLMVDVGVEAFLPGSQVDTSPVRNMDEFLSNTYDFKILKINKDRRNVVISRRELLEEEKSKLRSEIMEDITPGQLRKGTVKNITDFGAFVDLNGIDGLIHITDMSWGRISHPSEMLEVGQEIEAVILEIDREKERVSLGLKQKSNDPWENVEQTFPAGTRVKGKVVNVMPYGAFIEIVEGVEGLIHVSEMSWTKRVTRASDVLNVGDEVEAVVLEIQKDSKKISLGLRQTQMNPWEEAARKYPPGTKITGKVRNMTSYGAFVEIEQDIDGMVHISDMSWTRKINNPAELLKKGDVVSAIVLEINPDQQRISLSMKDLSENPWDKISEFYKIGDSVKGTVTKLTNFGAFVELENDIDGLIHISQLSDERVNKVKDIIAVGDQVEARVIKIDPVERRIGLTMKSADAIANVETAAAADVQNLKPGEHMVDMGDLLDDVFESGQE